MADDPGAVEVVESVVVVDQGSDPLESRPRFAAVGERLGPRLRYVRQPNLGGAGGFTRGLFEATAGDPADDRDVLLMDDDVLLEPEILDPAHGVRDVHRRIRRSSAARCSTCCTRRTCTSAPSTPSPRALRVGRAVPGALKEAYLLGHDERDLPTVQDQRIDTEYNGWWACLIPAAVVRAIGYPLPLFFQWDDIEYGYRARAHGFPTVALPGAGVWHADFGWKDWDEWHRYFNMRNGLITAALHTPFSVRRIGRDAGHAARPVPRGDAVRAGGDADPGRRRLPRRARRCCVTGRPPPRRRSAGSARRTRRRTMRPVSSVEGDFREMQVVRAPNEPGHEVLTWLKRAAYHLTDRAVHPTGMVVAGDAHWWHVSTFRRAVVTDMSEQGLRVRTRDRARARGAGAGGEPGRWPGWRPRGRRWRRSTGRRWAR